MEPYMERQCRGFFRRIGRKVNIPEEKLMEEIRKIIDENKNKMVLPPIDEARINMLNKVSSVLDERIQDYAMNLMDILIRQFQIGIEREFQRVIYLFHKHYDPEKGISEEGLKEINKPFGGRK